MNAPARFSAVENTVGGCLVQLLSLPAGVVAFVLLWFVFGDAPNGWIMAALIGGAVAFGALVLGRQYATVWKCAACRNKLADAQVRQCPTCRAWVA